MKHGPQPTSGRSGKTLLEVPANQLMDERAALSEGTDEVSARQARPKGRLRSCWNQTVSLACIPAYRRRLTLALIRVYDLTAFVETMTSPAVLLLLAMPPSLQPGRNLYVDNCVACHGMQGEGGEGASLIKKLKYGNDSRTLFRIIKFGVPNTLMPGIELADDQVQLLAGYVRWLNQESQKTGKAKR
jgi:cytochrome c553